MGLLAMIAKLDMEVMAIKRVPTQANSSAKQSNLSVNCYKTDLLFVGDA